MHRLTLLLGLATTAGTGFLVADAATAAEIEVIFTEVPGHSTATVPGARDLAGAPIFTEFKAIEEIGVSSTGSHWLLRGRNLLGSDLETMYLVGSGVDGMTLLQEGQPVIGGVAGEVYEFMGNSSPPAFDSTGRYTITARARGGDPSVKHLGYYHDGTGLQLIRRESDPALGLLDVPANPTGDELFGNSFGSLHPLDDGSIGSLDPTIKNIHSSRRPALFYGDTAFRQVGVDDIEEHLWESFDSGSFRATPDGEHWLVIGRDDGPDTEDVVLAINDTVALREGHPVAGSSIVMADVFNAGLAPSGTWHARGDDPADDDWAVLNGALVAATGQPITPGSAESWGASFPAFAANSAGDWVLAGSTDNPDVVADNVLVLNGETVLVRENDPVDLDGNGAFDDDAFIGRGDPALSGAFKANALAITDDGWVYFVATLHDSEGSDLGDGTGDAFLRIYIGDGECFLDLDGSGAVDVGDLLIVLGAWDAVGHEADLDGSGTVDIGDLLLVLGGWGPC